MPRGKGEYPPKFKPNAERIVREARERVGRTLYEHCPARAIARDLGYYVWSTRELAGFVRSGALEEFAGDERRAGALDHLGTAGSGFDAVVLDMDGYRVILHKDVSSPARQESDLMHELAHVLLGHEACYFHPRAPFALPKRDPDLERHAKWLGHALQIPEEGFIHYACRGYDNERIATHFGCSVEAAQFRRYALGIDRRVARWRGGR